MALNTERILTAVTDALEADEKFVGPDGEALEGDDLDTAKELVTDGARYIVAAIVDEIQANAEVSVTITGTAATDGKTIDLDPIDGARDGEILEDAGVTGTGTGSVS